MLKTLKIEEPGNDDKPRVHIVVSPAIFAMLLGAVFTGGAGSYGIANKGAEASQLQACTNDSQVALQRINELERKVHANWEDLDSRSRYRWTIDDQSRYERAIDSRFGDVEREMEKVKALCVSDNRSTVSVSSNRNRE